MVPEHIVKLFADTKARIDTARAALDEMERQVQRDWPTAPPPPPPPTKPTIGEMIVEPRPGALRVVWQVEAPTGLTTQVVGWGRDGRFLGSVSLHAGVREHLIQGLDPVKHEVDVLLLVGADISDRRRETATPQQVVGSPPPPPPGGGVITRNERDAIVSAAGARLDGSHTAVVAPTWTPPTSTVTNVEVHGDIWWDRPEKLTLRNVRCWRVIFAEGAGTLDAEGCTMTGHPSLPLGSGGINFHGQTGWRIHRCEFRGTGDGIQCVGPGVLSASWIHDLVVGQGPSGPTHNDGMQNYGGVTRVEHCVIEMPPDNFGRPDDQLNGCLFADGGHIHAVRSWLTSPVQALNTKANASIRCEGCHIVGRVVGNVTRV